MTEDVLPSWPKAVAEVVAAWEEWRPSQWPTHKPAWMRLEAAMETLGRVSAAHKESRRRSVESSRALREARREYAERVARQIESFRALGEARREYAERVARQSNRSDSSPVL